jgi:hypothetical protein
MRPPNLRDNELGAFLDAKYADLVFAVGLAVRLVEQDIAKPEFITDHGPPSRTIPHGGSTLSNELASSEAARIQSATCKPCH